jgi:hypothetical protein
MTKSNQTTITYQSKISLLPLAQNCPQHLKTCHAAEKALFLHVLTTLQMQINKALS